MAAMSMTAAATEIDPGREWEMIEAQLPSNWRALAEEMELVSKRRPPGVKVTDIEPILRLVFYHVATNTSLQTTTAMGSAAGIMTLSAVALHKWMRKLGPYVAELLEHTTNTKEIFAAERWAGYDIRVVDASTVTRPGACTTTARVHYELQLTSLRPTQIVVTDVHGGESFTNFEAEPGQLYLGDRGYAHARGIASICAEGADVLVRHAWKYLPLYNGNGTKIDVFQRFKRLRKRKPGRVDEWVAYVHPPEGDPIRGRLCAVRLPADKAKEARKRLRREAQRKCKPLNKSALQAAGFVLVFTTIPSDRLSKNRVMELYGLRWQVELSFKREKSIAGLGKLPNFRDDSIYTWLCTKLLLTQIARKIASPDVILANILGPKPAKALPSSAVGNQQQQNRNGLLGSAPDTVASAL